MEFEGGKYRGYMASEPRIIHVEPGSELDRLLDEVADLPVEVEKNGVRYRLDRVSPAMHAPPTSEQIARSIAGIRRAAGAWNGLVDPDEFTAYVYARRRTSNRPSVTI
jgi:hypothetical protein